MTEKIRLCPVGRKVTKIRTTHARGSLRVYVYGISRDYNGNGYLHNNRYYSYNPWSAVAIDLDPFVNRYLTVNVDPSPFYSDTEDTYQWDFSTYVDGSFIETRNTRTLTNVAPSIGTEAIGDFEPSIIVNIEDPNIGYSHPPFDPNSSYQERLRGLITTEITETDIHENSSSVWMTRIGKKVVFESLTPNDTYALEGTFYTLPDQAPPVVEWYCDGILWDEDTFLCPPGTCSVLCGDTVCCYGSDGVAISSYPLQ